jgi:hypothetical protein
MIRRACPLFLGLVSLLTACAGPQSEGAASPDPGAGQAAPAGVAAAEPAAPAAPAAPAEPPKAEAPKKVEPVLTVKDVGFQTPESVLYDATDDIYLVSNINGIPGVTDNNGFISKVSPEGKVTELKWIAGGEKGAKLDAPKGMAIVGDTLYVADLTLVRMFDRKTGKSKGDIKPAGATFMNDLHAGSDGKVYATDSGLKITEKGREQTKSDSVWVIEKNKAKSIAKSEELGIPNGIFFADGKVWVVSAGSGEMYRIDDKGKRQDTLKLPKARLDGLIILGDTVIISGWDDEAIYRGKLGGPFETVVTGLKAPADLGYDTKRSRVLVPLFNDNVVVVYDMK